MRYIVFLLLTAAGCASHRSSVEVRVEAEQEADVRCVAVFRVTN